MKNCHYHSSREKKRLNELLQSKVGSINKIFCEVENTYLWYVEYIVCHEYNIYLYEILKKEEKRACFEASTNKI